MTMNTSRASLMRSLRDHANRFDAESNARKRDALDRLAKRPLVADAALADYHDALLFIGAHPPDANTLKRVEAEFKRLSVFLKGERGRHTAALADRGLPCVDTITRFTHDCNRWLLVHPHCRVALDPCGEPLLDLNAVLKLTPPALERNETTASLSNDELLDVLKVKPAHRLAFLVKELSRLDATPYVKDQLFDAFDLYVRVKPTSTAFSKSYNRLALSEPVFLQPDLLRKFDPMAVMNERLPTPRRMTDDQRADTIQVLKNTMALTRRETDPATYLDPTTLRVYDLARGLTCAIFGMTPDRQLQLESYVSFTLFKNGFPMAYGGSWIVGKRAAFGVNIFEPFRGGESGFMMCQVLRTYRQTFGVRYFEVDAHQFGLDIPDGIASGAFWFYFWHGFRPLSAPLLKLPLQEKERIDKRPGYRSPEKTLLRFTESNVALNFGGPVPPHLFDVTTRVTKMIAGEYAGDLLRAEADGVARFGQAAGLRPRLNAAERRALTEVALIWHTLKVKDALGTQLLARMVRAKPKDVFAYQKLMLAFFSVPRVRRNGP